MTNPKVSVVINTCNRGAYIGDTLKGLGQQTYNNFEVIVVNGPSEDNTQEVIKQFNVRYYDAPYNISVSRNIGIKHAAGDIIAFIDDDAVPETNWLKDLVAAYKDPEVGAAGGFVYNHDGSWFQFCYGAIDKWGYPVQAWDKPYGCNDPNGALYNINIGTNASYRRDVLIKIGGFDEEIEYYHDESDVCVRVIKAGYKVAQLDNAYVHHKMAPSYRRNDKKQVTNWDAVVKNVIYFGLKHSKGNAPSWERIIRPGVYESKKFLIMFRDLLKGNYNPYQYIVRNLSLFRAIFRGYWRGFRQAPKIITNYKYEPEAFRKFIADNPNTLDMILVSQGFPPNNTDGISRYNHTLAKEMANRGHRIYVITKSQIKHPQIFYREGYWVYCHAPDEYLTNETGYARTDNVLALNKSIYDTALGISKKGKVDFILAPLWDAEGAALLRQKFAPTAITLMSPLKKVVETQWFWLNDPSLEVMYGIEKYCIEAADGVMAISKAIKDTIGQDYDIDWSQVQKKSPVEVVPLGVDSSLVGPKEDAPRKKDGTSLLFVGRFEKRKGIDLLLDTLPSLLTKHKDLMVDLVGKPDITDENGKYPYKEFIKKYRHKNWFSRIHQHGYVSDEELNNLYAECDIFVAPSRYESFGIIFIEAMAHSKPVIGADVGGIPEIIRDEVNGLLFKPGDSADLKTKLDRLISDQKLREKMGRASKKILESEFSSKEMGDRFIKFAAKVMHQSE